MTAQLTPDRTNVEIGTYALAIHEGGQILYQFEKPTPWENPEWVEKSQYDHGEVPPLNLEQTQVEQQTNGDSLQKVTLYASKLNANSDPTDMASNSSQGTETDSYRGYIIKFSDGQFIPDQDRTVHTTQEQNMGAAIDYLVRDYDMTDKIDIPHFPPRARQNCSINSEPKHPHGDEMRSPHELPDENYLHTALNRQGKVNRIEDLANQVGLSVDFLGNW